MSTLEIILLVITILMLFTLAFWGFGYFLIKRIIRHTNLELDKSNADHNQTVSSIDARVEITNSILDTILTLINSEIIILMRSYTSLNIRYELKKIDSDIKTISENVFKAIKPEIYSDENLILTNEYLMKFIISETTLMLIQNVQKYNAQLTLQ